MDMTLTGVTSLGQVDLGVIGNEGVLHILQSSRTGASPSNGSVSYTGHSLEGRERILLLCKGAVDIFYSPSQQGRLDASQHLIRRSGENDPIPKLEKIDHKLFL